MERRGGERRETNIPLACRLPATPVKGVMRDVSIGGCRVHLPESVIVEEGATALVDLPGALRWPGRIVWTRHNVIGVRFQRLLSGPPAVQLGLEAPPPEPEPEIAPVDTGVGLLRHWFRRLTGAFS